VVEPADLSTRTMTDEGAPGDGAAASANPQLVAVSRSGGFTGMTRSAELDLDTDPQGPEVRDLLGGVDLEALSSSTGAADRFVYTVQYGSTSVTLGEQDLTPELHRVVKLVLGNRPGSPPTSSAG
jgi:hypothetical protein